MSHQNEENYFQVQDLPPSIVRTRIKKAMEAAANRSLEIAPRETPNLIYVSGRVCMKSSEKLQVQKASEYKCHQILGLLKILLDLNEKQEFLSKYLIFYKNQELFQTRNECDNIIDDVCCLLGVTQRSLKIEQLPKGMVIGPILIRQDDKILNLQELIWVGIGISPCMSDFDVVSCAAKFILVVEKRSTYFALIDYDFHKTVQCIMITGNGMPDVPTRYFLRSLTKKLNNKLPVLALIDYNPTGIEVMCAYTCGSESLAYDSENLVTPGIKWFGVRPTDWETYRYDLGRRTKKLSPEEELALKDLKKKDFLMDKTSWVNEISSMLKSERTYNLEEIHTDTVLAKFEKKDWLP